MFGSSKIVAALAALSLAGCANAMPLQLNAGMPASASSNSITEVYSRIARGAMTCWFGSGGPLKPTHIFFADVAPPSSGGAAEIVIHERDLTQPSPWGRRAFRVMLRTVDGSTTVEIENLAMPDDVAGRMRDDVLQWRDDKTSCQVRDAAGSRAAPLPARPWREPASDSSGNTGRGA